MKDLIWYLCVLSTEPVKCAYNLILKVDLGVFDFQRQLSTKLLHIDIS